MKCLMPARAVPRMTWSQRAGGEAASSHGEEPDPQQTSAVSAASPRLQSAT